MTTTPAPQQEPTHHIEWTGNIQVHQPIRPTVYEAAKAVAVSCA